MGPLSRHFLPNHTTLCVKSFLSSPEKTDSLSHGSSGSTGRSSVIRPRPVHLQRRTCWQALYQSCPPPSSPHEKRARGPFRIGHTRPPPTPTRLFSRPLRPPKTNS